MREDSKERRKKIKWEYSCLCCATKKDRQTERDRERKKVRREKESYVQDG